MQSWIDRDAFRREKGVKMLLLSVLITGLSSGLYRGVLDNFLAEVVHMGEMDRGVTEFFRELPGILLVFILAAFYMLSAETMYKTGALIMLGGMTMMAVLPADKVLITLAICVYSLGEHIQLGMKSTLALKYASPGRGGVALGVRNITCWKCSMERENRCFSPLQPVVCHICRCLFLCFAHCGPHY